MSVFVLVHGAFHGAWCWDDVARRLRDAGHAVHVPTLPGLGERADELSRDLTIDGMVADVVAFIETAGLDDVVLVGHSFGAVVASGVADRIPARLRRLVFLDGLLVDGGASPFDGVAPEVVAARKADAETSSGGLSIPAPSAAAFGVRDPERARFVEARLTPHPLSAYTSPLTLAHPIGNGVPVTYVTCSDPLYAPLAGVRARVATLGWPVRTIATGHDAMVTAPAETAALLTDIARSR